LAYLYLKLWWENQSHSGNHIILPPSAARTRIGIPDPDPDNDNDEYWNTFFSKVHTPPGFGIGTCPTLTQISPEQMKVLHTHHYTDNPQTFNPIKGPIETAANDASIIREAADWFRITHNGGTELKMHIVLSEFGQDWSEDPLPSRYAGWFTNMRDGLSWWNTYLCWLTRLASTECNLDLDDPNGYTVFAAIHNPSSIPYTKNPGPGLCGSSSQRNQKYFDPGQGNLMYYNIPHICTGLPACTPPGGMTYQGSFSSHEKIPWQPSFASPRQWNVMPFGVCYAVWSEVGTDLVDIAPGAPGTPPPNGGLESGWVTSSTPGTSGGPGNSIPLTARVSLPPGWSTIYFPVIKDFGDMIGDQVRFEIWTHIGGPEGPDVMLGEMRMVDFPDSVDDHPVAPVYPLSATTQDVYSAMIFPVVCHSVNVTPTLVTITIKRFHNATNDDTVWLGRPIVLEKACSWFIEQ
jgi:hypothetical protein